MKRRLMFCITPLGMGILTLTYVMSKPRFETYQGSDVWTLVASGACLAVGFGMLFGRIRLPRE